MTDREPYLALRDFRVWFAKRRGFLEALRRADPGHVRAVDGIDVTIGKGEIYCLVGESGCGKTTTGKGILQLVEPTGGDVFLNPTTAELAEFDASQKSGDHSSWEGLRERRSLTWKEHVHRSASDWLLQGLLATAGALLGALAAFGLILGLRALPGVGFDLVGYVGLGALVCGMVLESLVFVTKFTPRHLRSLLSMTGVVLLGIGIFLGLRALGASAFEGAAYLIIGIGVGFASTVPWVKVTHRIRQLMAVGTIPASIFTQILAVGASEAAAGRASDFGSALGAYGNLMLNNAIFVAFIEIALAAISAWLSSGFFDGFWDRRHGLVTDRLRALRTRLQMIFQDPYESLNPRHTVYDIVAEPLVVNRITRSRAETEARVEQALNDAGLRPPRDYLLRLPHEMSGGQRQRVGIAGALVLEPEFLVADEPVSMLDVSIRTEIIELLLQLRTQKALTYLFITHDLSLAWVLADRIGVMYLGKIVEEGPTLDLISNPRHPYTKALISVVPIPDPDHKHERTILRGERPDPSDIPPGCRFHPRCPVAFERCGWTSEEVLGALQGLPAAQGSPHLEGAELHGIQAITWPRTNPEFEPWLRGLIASHGEEYRALKAIQSIERSGNGTKVILHPFEEPTLKSVAGAVRVSCHLFT